MTFDGFGQHSPQSRDMLLDRLGLHPNLLLNAAASRTAAASMRRHCAKPGVARLQFEDPAVHRCRGGAM